MGTRPIVSPSCHDAAAPMDQIRAKRDLRSSQGARSAATGRVRQVRRSSTARRHAHVHTVHRAKRPPLRLLGETCSCQKPVCPLQGRRRLSLGSRRTVVAPSLRHLDQPLAARSPQLGSQRSSAPLFRSRDGHRLSLLDAAYGASGLAPCDRSRPLSRPFFDGARRDLIMCKRQPSEGPLRPDRVAFSARDVRAPDSTDRLTLAGLGVGLGRSPTPRRRGQRAWKEECEREVQGGPPAARLVQGEPVGADSASLVSRLREGAAPSQLALFIRFPAGTFSCRRIASPRERICIPSVLPRSQALRAVPPVLHTSPAV